MIRMKGAPPQAQTPPDTIPVDQSQETPDEVVDEPKPDDSNQGGGGQADQSTVGYKGPEQGPFKCSNCVFYSDPGTCSVVSGDIDPDGVCNIFTSQGNQPQDESQTQIPPEALAGLLSGAPPPPMGGPPGA